MLISLRGDNRQSLNVISLDHCLNHPTGEEEREKRKKRRETEREAYRNSVMKLNLIPYLFISLPASPSLLGLILMKRPQMTSFRVKLIGFGPTRLHFLPGYFPLFGGAENERKTDRD